MALTGKITSNSSNTTVSWSSNVIWAIVAIWILTLIFGPWRTHSHHWKWGDRDEDEALEILRKRYASGEITKEQFEQMIADLEKVKK